MKTVSAIETQRGNKHRVNVHLDGRYAISVDAFLAAKENVAVGRSLTDEELAELVRQDEFRRCFEAALRFLGYRPRSEAEVRQRLRKRAFREDVVEAVLVKLRDQQLLDDSAFAQFWLENRHSFSPRGERLLRLELRQKGVDAEIVKELADGVDEAESAYRAAQKKLRSLNDCDYREFHCQLASFLQRRGFDYETTSQVIARMWEERQANDQQRTPCSRFP